AAIVLRCVEEGRLTLDDRLAIYAASSAEPNATIRQVLAHTGDDGVFRYRPDRVALLTPAIEACAGYSFRERVANFLTQQAMFDSVPGGDVVQLAALPTGISSVTLDRYRAVLARLALPYAVDQAGRATLSRYSATTITPASGLIATERDLASFVVALRKGGIVR